jgi:hypothetical protein
MRFAGSKVEDFLSGRPNMGKLSQQGAIVNSNEIAAGTEAQGMVAASGVAAQAKAKQAEILGAAQAQQAQSQATGQMWSSLGSSIAGGLGSINFGSGLTTGSSSNKISDPTSTFKSLSGPGGALEGGVYDYWG